MILFNMLLASNPEGEGSSIFTTLIFISAIFFVFYFFMIRPQNKRQKEIREKIAAMKKGDKVTTTSGIIGTISFIEEQTILLQVDTTVKLRILKTAIADVNNNKETKSN